MPGLKRTDSSSSLVSSSIDHPGHEPESPDEGKSHAERPKLGVRQEKTALLNPASQRKLADRSAKSGEAESKDRGRKSKQPSISTQPPAPPRNASLKPGTADRSERTQPLPSDMTKTGSRSLRRQGRNDAPDTSSKKTGRSGPAVANFRKKVLTKDNAVAAMGEIKLIYTTDSTRSFSKMGRAVLGNTKWICAEKTSPEENNKYFDKVWELYQSTEDDAEVIARMQKRIEEIKKLERPAHQFTAATSMVNLMLFRLTPNQRHQLRQDFPGLYFSATVTDDINWLFFDTIVRATISDDTEQKKLMLKLYKTPRDKHIKKRDKIKDEFAKARYKIREKHIREYREIGDNRLNARDKIRDKLHGKMSTAQRAELKKICKARYDELTNSKLPAIHVLIRDENQEAMMAYMNKVLRYAPPEERARLLMARCDSSKGKETGDAAFFALAHSGNVNMMEAYLKRILYTKRLTVSQKSEVLKAFRREDGVTPFHLMMCAGDWPRVDRFVRTIYKWKHAQDDYLCVSDDAERETVYVTPTRPFYKCTIADVVEDLLRAPVDDHTRPGGVRNAYTSAMELGKEECATKFKKVMLHERMRDLFYSADLWNMTILLTSDPKKNTREQDEAARVKATEEAALHDVLELLDCEGKDPKQRDYELRGFKLVEEAPPGEIQKRMEAHPEIMRLTPEERSKLAFKLYATEKYLNVNEKNRIALKDNEKKDAKRSSAPSSPKSKNSSSLPTTGLSPADRSSLVPIDTRNSKGLYQLNGLSRSFHTMPELNLPEELKSPRPSPGAAPKAPPPSPASPSSPYQKKKQPKSGDKDRLIDTSESEGG
jgi:hypothetical protein